MGAKGQALCTSLCLPSTLCAIPPGAAVFSCWGYALAQWAKAKVLHDFQISSAPDCYDCYCCYPCAQPSIRATPLEARRLQSSPCVSFQLREICCLFGAQLSILAAANLLVRVEEQGQVWRQPWQGLNADRLAPSGSTLAPRASLSAKRPRELHVLCYALLRSKPRPSLNSHGGGHRLPQRA